VIAYRAMLDVPRELLAWVANLLRARRRQVGTRRKRRALTCWNQALMVLAWYRKREEMTALAAAFAVSRATAYRYRDEVIEVLGAQAPDLHDALQQVAEQGWSHVVLDGKVFRTNRCAAVDQLDRLRLVAFGGVVAGRTVFRVAVERLIGRGDLGQLGAAADLAEGECQPTLAAEFAARSQQRQPALCADLGRQ
jgi:Helix-turn-helix of DDE superfamily endonuclease